MKHRLNGICVILSWN